MLLKSKCFHCKIISVLASFYEEKNLFNVLIQSHEFVSCNITKHLTVTDSISRVSIVTGRVKYFWEFGWRRFGSRMTDEQKTIQYHFLFLLYCTVEVAPKAFQALFRIHLTVAFRNSLRNSYSNSLSLQKILHQLSHEWAWTVFLLPWWFALILQTGSSCRVSLALELVAYWTQNLWNINGYFVAIQFKLLMIHGVQFNITFKTNFTCA